MRRLRRWESTADLGSDRDELSGMRCRYSTAFDEAGAMQRLRDRQICTGYGQHEVHPLYTRYVSTGDRSGVLHAQHMPRGDALLERGERPAGLHPMQGRYRPA